MKTTTILLIAILILAPSTLAHDNTRCTESDCPLWARGSYNTPTTTHYDTRDNYWYDDTQYYVFYDVYHPPKHYYVHYNKNYYTHYRNTYRHNYRNNYYRQSPTVLHGDGFTRYY